MKRFLKKLLARSSVQAVLAWIASRMIRLIIASIRWERCGEEHPRRLLEAGQPFIVCFWHNRLLLMFHAWQGMKAPFTMLSSGHRDGQLIGRVSRHFGIDTLIGSRSRKKGKQHQGAAAYRQMLRHLSTSRIPLGITPDGPKGPRERVGEGTARLAALSGAPLLPLTISTANRHVLKTWDRFLIPLPFGRGRIAWGAPIEGRDPADLEARLQQALEDLTKNTDAAVGVSAC